MTTHDLASDRLRLRVSPEIGGSIVGLEVRVASAWLAWMRPATQPLLRASDAASFTLAPYSNRVRDGRFVFEGREHRLRDAAHHAIHGDVRDRRWRVVAHAGGLLTLALDADALGDLNFPFPFRAEQRFSVDGPRLEQSLRIVNSGLERMPAGGGFHPYFLRALGHADEDVRLETSVSGVYPGDTPLPTGPPVPPSPAQRHDRLRPIERGLDHCFAGWSGRARLEWPASGVRARLEADEPLRHLVLYTPRDRPFFAIEPVSNANDGFNLLAAGQRDTGVVVLEPGEALELRWRIVVED